MQDKKWWLVCGLALLSVGSNFWGFPIYILDEAKNAACAMEMMQRGDWVIPTFNGVLRTDKPPLHYFFMILSYQLFGISPFAARLFSIVMGLATVGLVYGFVNRMISEMAAFFSSLILISSFFFVIQFHLAVPDPYLICFLTAGWLSFGYAHLHQRPNFYLISYAALALAFMSKGPVAIVLSGVIFIMFLALRRELSASVLIRMRILSGVAIFIGITAPWWLAVTLATRGAWLKGFVWEHNVGRYISTMEGHEGIPGIAVALLFVALLPLSFFLPGAVRLAWTGRRENPVVLFSLVVVGAVLLFFSFSKTILPNYIGPAVPFGAIMLGSFISKRMNDLQTRGIRKAGSIFIAIIALLIPFILKGVIEKDHWIHDLAVLRWITLPVSGGALVALYFVFKNQWRNSLLAYLLSSWVFCALLFNIAAPVILSKNPVTRSLPMVSKPGMETVAYGNFNPAYVFALQRPLITFTAIDELVAYTANKPVILISRKEYEQQLKSVGFEPSFEGPYLFEYPVVMVLTNRP